jgi:hypothetical protein
MVLQRKQLERARANVHFGSISQVRAFRLVSTQCRFCLMVIYISISLYMNCAISIGFTLMTIRMLLHIPHNPHIMVNPQAFGKYLPNLKI